MILANNPHWLCTFHHFTNIMPYYGHIHETAELYHRLSKVSHKFWHKNENAICTHVLKDNHFRITIDATDKDDEDYSKYFQNNESHHINLFTKPKTNKRCLVDRHCTCVKRDTMFCESKLGYIISRRLHLYFSFDLKLSTVKEYRSTIKLLASFKNFPTLMINQINCLVNHSTSKVFCKLTEIYKAIGLSCGLSLDSVPLKIDPSVPLDEIIKLYFVNKIKSSESRDLSEYEFTSNSKDELDEFLKLIKTPISTKPSPMIIKNLNPCTSANVVQSQIHMLNQVVLISFQAEDCLCFCSSIYFSAEPSDCYILNPYLMCKDPLNLTLEIHPLEFHNHMSYTIPGLTVNSEMGQLASLCEAKLKVVLSTPWSLLPSPFVFTISPYSIRYSIRVNGTKKLKKIIRKLDSLQHQPNQQPCFEVSGDFEGCDRLLKVLLTKKVRSITFDDDSTELKGESIQALTTALESNNTLEVLKIKYKGKRWTVPFLISLRKQYNLKALCLQYLESEEDYKLNLDDKEIMAMADEFRQMRIGLFIKINKVDR